LTSGGAPGQLPGMAFFVALVVICALERWPLLLFALAAALAWGALLKGGL
jgi:hypothetical protein